MDVSPYRNQEDLIILGLEWSVDDQELKSYFAQFGELSHCEVGSVHFCSQI